jgi:alkyl sulfatase BDS1-like metallo-beta-lactamase superfamily hydrolase
VKADGVAFTANLITPDNGEQYVIELSNGTLTNLKGYLADAPDLTLTINRTDLELAMMGAAPLMEQIADGRAVLEGDGTILQTLASLLVHFELGFQIMPGTGGAKLSALQDAFAQEPLADTAGA